MKEKIELDNDSYWQRVFAQSKVNNAPYFGELLPRWPRKWPQGTWFQHQLRKKARRSEHGGNRLD